MKLRVKDVIFFLFISFILFLVTRPFFLDFASQYSLAGGFVKFFVLASIGDVLAKRLKDKNYSLPNGFLFKAIVWGLIGVSIVYMFGIYTSGVSYLQEQDLLAFADSKLATAFFISLFMNLTYAPTMMLLHRISDNYIEQKISHNMSFKESLKSIDYPSFYAFTLGKTIPLFWIPAHTITFLLPAEYRIIFAALLGIVLGLLLGLAKGEKDD
jgi:hypothetical protein